MKCPICNQENTGALQIHLDLFHRRKELIRHIVGDQNIIAAIHANLAALQSGAAESIIRDQAGEILRLRAALENRDGEQAETIRRLTDQLNRVEIERNNAEQDFAAQAQELHATKAERDALALQSKGLREIIAAQRRDLAIVAMDLAEFAGWVQATFDGIRAYAQDGKDAPVDNSHAGEGEAIRLQCPDCGIWYDLALGHDCEETKPEPGEGEGAPVQYIEVGDPSFSMLNALAWYIRNATQPDGDPGWNSQGLTEYGPAHKLLIALDSYIKATNGGK